MKTQKSKYTPQDFIDALNKGEQAMILAAEILVDLVEADIMAYHKLIKMKPGLSLKYLADLERVGRKLSRVEYLYDNSPAAMRVKVMSYEMQTKMLTEPLKVVSLEDGKKVVRPKLANTLDRDEVNVVFDNQNQVRTVDEQVEYLKAQVPPPEPAIRHRYKIENGNFVIFATREEVVFTLSELQDILDRMTQQALKDLARK